MSIAFIPYNKEVKNKVAVDGGAINSFMTGEEKNLDPKTVESFGEEWSKFDFFDEEEIENVGNDYFDIVTSEHINKETTTALDVGCGTGRWTKYLAPRVHLVECIDPSKAVLAAHRLLREHDNVRITQAGVDDIPFDDDTFDLVFSLGVLHHVPNTADALKKCVRKVKPGGHFLVYLYYNLDNRGPLFKLIFHLSNSLRWVICRLPQGLKSFVCDVLAYLIYAPMIGLTKLVKALAPGKRWHKNIPLSWYAEKSFKIAKNDSLDRFGTPLEQRFSKKEIERMMADAGLSNIVFSEKEPYWHAIGQKKK